MSATKFLLLILLTTIFGLIDTSLPKISIISLNDTISLPAIFIVLLYLMKLNL